VAFSSKVVIGVLVDELGSLLREARETKGLSLEQAQDKTRINARFLAALEEGQFQTLPTPVHVRGYLRNYARFLGLDPRPLLERYELSKDRFIVPETRPSTNGDLPDKALPLGDDQVFFDPVNVEIAGRGNRSGGSTQRLVIIAALILTLALVANRFVPMLTGRGDGSEALTNGINEAVNNIVNGDGPELTPSPNLTLVPGAGQVITSTERNSAIQLPTPTATRPSLPVTLETIQLKLEITERTWMRVTIDGEIVFEGLARGDDEPYEWVAQREATLLTGNAIGIFVTINNIDLGKLGGRGEVVEETWTTTGG
jgi:cytoskeleton protein RodZ